MRLRVIVLGLIGAAIIWQGTEELSSPQSIEVVQDEWLTPQSIVEKLARQMAAREAEMSFRFRATSSERMMSEAEQMIRDAMNVDDYTRYVVESYTFQSSYYEGERDATITLTMSYRESLPQTEYVTRQAQAALAAMSLEQAASDALKARRIHDYIVKKFAYDETLERNTAYDGFAHKLTVCQGYALAIHRMLRLASIPNKIVEGTADGVSHAWNLVQIDGKWFHLDATYDDPIPDRRGKASHAYFLKSDRVMSRDHQWNKADYPAAPQSY